jgi:hypothetical protein
MSPTMALAEALTAMLAPAEDAIAQKTEIKGDDQDKLLHATIVQTLGYVALRAVHLGLSQISDAICEQAMLPVMLALEPGSAEAGGSAAGQGNASRSQSRQNASMHLMILAATIGSPALADTVASAFARCTEDSDRYVMAYAYEGIRRMSAAEIVSKDEPTPAELAAQALLDKTVYERWCPHTGAGLSSF